MKHKNHHKTIHQHIEQFLRHKIILAAMLAVMFMGVISTDARFRELMRSAYMQGWGFIGTYLTHEHPSHQHATITIVRTPTVSGQ